MIPLLFDFEGRTVLVVGGGRVGARKARRFDREAEVIVLARSFEGDFGDADRVRADLDPADAGEWVERTDPALVVAATDAPALNDAFAEAARATGALVNRADQSGSRGPGGVVVPATVRDGPVTVAVATDGTSPALSRHLRQTVADEIAGAGAMATLTADIRAELAHQGHPAERRREALRAVVGSPDVWKALRTGTPNPRQTAEAVIDDVLPDDGAADVEEQT